jgi:hypothetical protein
LALLALSAVSGLTNGSAALNSLLSRLISRLTLATVTPVVALLNARLTVTVWWLTPASLLAINAQVTVVGKTLNNDQQRWQLDNNLLLAVAPAM